MSTVSPSISRRVAEELVFGVENVTTGASSDIKQATNLARRMVTEFGFSDKLGPLRYSENEEEVFLGCCLALYYSKARTGMEGEVWFSERKFVQKKKGMPPGMVLLTQGKPKYIRADQSFFAKLQREDGE